MEIKWNLDQKWKGLVPGDVFELDIGDAHTSIMQFAFSSYCFTSTEGEIGKAQTSKLTPATAEWSVQTSEIPQVLPLMALHPIVSHSYLSLRISLSLGSFSSICTHLLKQWLCLLH